MFLMLRASSPGLNLLKSRFFTFHSCQRVYRFGARTTSKKTGACPLDHIASKNVEECSPLTGEQVHTKIGSPLPPISAPKSASELQLSESGSTKPIQTTGKVLEEVYGALDSPESRPISQSPPSYAAGRPWSPENIKKVNLPKYILSPLRRLRIETERTYRYEQAQNAGKTIPKKTKRKSPHGDPKQAQNAGEDTPSVKESPLQDNKQAQNAAEDTPSIKEPPLQDNKQEQNADEDTPSMKPLRGDHQKVQNAGEDTPSTKEPPLQDNKQEQDAGDHKRAQNAVEDAPSTKKPPLRDYKQEQIASKVTLPMKKCLHDPASRLLQHFTIMATTDSVEKGWKSYVFLVDFISGSPVVRRHVQHIPFAHLHRMVRLLSRNRPQTRRQFLQLLAILTYINYWGGELKQYEWNALVVHAGSGWRKTTLGNVRKAMKVFNDMRAGRLPGSSDFLPPDREFLDGPPVEPDIYTLTSLLAIASRTVNSRKVHKISSMMSKAGLPPNRITHLSLMRYFTLKGDLDGIRVTLMKMRRQGLELGLDGLNSCLWAYGRNGRPDLVMMIYRILRHNVLPETDTPQKAINHIIEHLGEEYVFVEPEIQPNEVTFTTVIQVMAYHGHFSYTLNVFMDMLSFNNAEKGTLLEKVSAGAYERTSYKPSLAVFRAIFLGFSRHAKYIQHDSDSDWNMDNLSHIFELFLELPSDSNLTHNTIYFIMLAFDKASGRDNKKLRSVWERMDRRFGIVLHKAHSVSRLARLQRLLFPEKE